MAAIIREIRGYNRVRNGMRAMIAAHPREVDALMHGWAQQTRKHLKSKGYPARTSNYKRTGRLASSWATKRIKPGVWGVTNNAKAGGRFYAGYVVGPKSGAKGERQAWMHVPFWWRADEVIEQESIPILRNTLGDLYLELFDNE